MNNLQRLKLIQANYNLSRQITADLLGTSIYTINNWFRPNDSKYFAGVPDMAIQVLKLKLRLEMPLTPKNIQLMQRGKIWNTKRH